MPIILLAGRWVNYIHLGYEKGDVKMAKGNAERGGEHYMRRGGEGDAHDNPQMEEDASMQTKGEGRDREYQHGGAGMEAGEGGAGEEMGKGTEKAQHSGGGGAAQLQQYLRGVDYPADKQDMIDAARSNSAPDDFMSFMNRLPDKTYNRPTEVEQEFSKIK
jgi:hypothetical protein